MIDLRTTGNFITRKIAEQHKYQMQDKETLYTLQVVDKNPISFNRGKVTEKTTLLRMTIVDRH